MWKPLYPDDYNASLHRTHAKSIPDKALQFAEGLGRGRAGALLHAAIKVKHLVAGRRKPGSTSCGTAFGGVDQRFAEGTVHVVHKLPSLLVAHAHGPSGCGNRPRLLNPGQKIGLTGAEGKATGKNQSDA